ncbi:MAG: MBL fold metallo-hydrolase [Burkholderiales bacterium]|nr:MBL fold metallo-hydrolase [Burkholderiales bacterium]MDR4517770.1 MBL fold metallo-hydrolase [Nitrosomonas sp.]
MKNHDSNEAIAITRDIYWIGFSEKLTRLHCNPYLLIEEDEAILFDPGSIPDFPVIMRKVIDLVNPNKISLVVVSHQDPDVCGNLAIVEDVIENDKLRIAAHKNTIRLIQHQDLRSDFYAVEENAYQITLKSGRVLEFLHVPFLHSPGAIVTYDTKTRSLFTGDIFGAVDDDDWSIFTSQNFPENMKSFHQAYMPGNKYLKRAMERFEKIPIDRILPQHGSVIESNEVQVAIDYLKQLPCGLDLIEN